MLSKYNFGLPVGGGGCGGGVVKLFKRVFKVASFASKYSTSLSMFAYTVSNSID